MQPFTSLTSRVIPLPYNNIDTDQIIPARYLKVTDKAGLAEGLFAEWRYHSDGKPDLEFPLNRPACQNAQILVAGDNFGCGSSREHALWALVGWGIRAVVSTTFADIFCSNAFKNGLLPVVVDPGTHQKIFMRVDANPYMLLTINLAEQTLVLPDGTVVEFSIEAFNKTCLLQGVDQLGYLLGREPEITRYEKTSRHWVEKWKSSEND